MKCLPIVLLVMTAVTVCSAGQNEDKSKNTSYGNVTLPTPATSKETHVSNATTAKERTVTLYLNSTVAFLYNRKIDGKEKLPIANQALLKNCSFEGSLSTYIVIHDFSQKSSEKPYMDLKDKLLQKEDCNVFFISWDGGNNRTDKATYLAAVKNVPSVAGQLAHFLQSLHSLKALHYDTLHIIGDGLGAHIAGQVMTHDDNNNIIGRITGLDPAGLTYKEDNENNRLNKKSASYVSVIHTNGCKKPHPAYYFECYGTYYPLGHTDFFVYDGMYQPRCSKKLMKKDGKGRPKFCDHDSAILYFLSSMDIDLSDTYFLARVAQDVNHFRNSPADCGNVPQYLGYHCNPSGIGNYYLNISGTAPYHVHDPLCPTAYRNTLQTVGVYLGFSLISAVSALVFVVPAVIFVRKRARSYEEFRRIGHGYTDEEDDDAMIAVATDPKVASISRILRENVPNPLDAPLDEPSSLDNPMIAGGESTTSGEGTSNVDLLAKNLFEGSYVNPLSSPAAGESASPSTSSPPIFSDFLNAGSTNTKSPLVNLKNSLENESMMDCDLSDDFPLLNGKNSKLSLEDHPARELTEDTTAPRKRKRVN